MAPFTNIKEQVATAKRIAMKELLRVGIDDNFVVKVKGTKSHDWIAQYRGNTQFTGAGRGPIFWVSPNIEEAIRDMNRELGIEEKPDVLSALVDSMLHEYGHVVAEWAHKRNEEMSGIIERGWPGSIYGRPWDEERFAEDFMQWLRGGDPYGSEKDLAKVTKLYVKDVFAPES